MTKRTIFFVFTESALYIRLPSEQRDAIIHRVVVDDVHKDLLSPKDKPQFNDYKCGITTYGPDYEKQIQQEQDMIDSSMQAVASFTRVKNFCHLRQ